MGARPRNGALLLMAAIVGVPALIFRVPEVLANVHLLEPSPWLSAMTFGAAIVGAALLLAWASDVAQMDISQALALAGLALVAVLPEYVVDAFFAWRAADDPQYASYAAASVTASNRLLVGVGWPLVAMLFWFRERGALRLRRGLALELVFLGAATVYAFSIPLKGSIALWDSVVLVTLFGGYIWLSGRAEKHEPKLVGPSALLGRLSPRARRTAVLSLFAYAALVIVLSVEPFAEGLIHGGREAGIDEFLLVQWVAPLATEAPEILIAVILTLRGDAAAAMTMLISAKVNQWTLLVGSLPVVYSLSLGEATALPLDSRQVTEFLLTASQSLFAVVLLIRMRMSWRAALVLLVLFTSQLLIPDERVRLIFAYIYLGGTLAMIVVDRGRLVELVHMGRGVVAEALGRTSS